VLAAVPELTPSIIESMTVVDINTRVVSIFDILERVSLNGEDRYLLLKGYSEKSIIIIGLEQHEYTLETRAVGDMTLATIRLTAESPAVRVRVLLPYFSARPARIFEEELRLRKCEEEHVDETVTVQIREVGAEFKEVIISEGKYSEETDEQVHDPERYYHLQSGESTPAHQESENKPFR
jgi:hypothetical protein